MSEQQELKNCSVCIHNTGGFCTSYNGYYIYREAIIDDKVPCNDWDEDKKLPFQQKKSKRISWFKF